MVQKVRETKGDAEDNFEEPEAYFAVHVDDVLVIGDGKVCEVLKQELTGWEGVLRLHRDRRRRVAVCLRR